MGLNIHAMRKERYSGWIWPRWKLPAAMMTEDAQIQTLMLDVKLIQPLLLLLMTQQWILLMTPLLVIRQWILLMTQQWILLMTPLLVIPQWILLMTQQWILLMTPLLVIRQELSTWVPSSRLF